MGVLAEEEMVGGWWVAVAPMAEEMGVGMTGPGEEVDFWAMVVASLEDLEAVAWAEATTVVQRVGMEDRRVELAIASWAVLAVEVAAAPLERLEEVALMAGRSCRPRHPV